MNKNKVLSILSNRSLIERIQFVREYLQYKNKDPIMIKALLNQIPMFEDQIIVPVLQDALREFECITVYSRTGEILKVY